MNSDRIDTNENIWSQWQKINNNNAMGLNPVQTVHIPNPTVDAVTLEHLELRKIDVLMNVLNNTNDNVDAQKETRRLAHDKLQQLISAIKVYDGK